MQQVRRILGAEFTDRNANFQHPEWTPAGCQAEATISQFVEDDPRFCFASVSVQKHCRNYRDLKVFRCQPGAHPVSYTACLSCSISVLPEFSHPWVKI